jgi:phosphatidylglycerophosphate synthase
VFVENLIMLALVICPSDVSPQTKIAGLTIGERLLLALSHSGVTHVIFSGDGPRPESQRAKLKIIAEIDVPNLNFNDFFLLQSNLVFDRALLKDKNINSLDLPIKKLPVDKFASAVKNHEQFISHKSSKKISNGKNFAICVNDKNSKKEAEKELYKSLAKPIDGFISRTLNRKISTLISRLLINTPVLPNQLTIFIMLLGIGSGIAAYFATWWSLVIAGVLFQTQSMLDGCDGEIARLKYLFSLKGQWLDTIGDDVSNYAFCLGLGLGQARLHNSSLLVVITFFIFAVQWYSSFIMYQRIYKMNTGDLLAIPNMVSGGEPKGWPGRLVRIIHTITKRDFFVFVTSLLTIFQFPLTAFILIAAGSLIMAPALTMNEIKIRKAIKNGTL